MPYAKTSVFFDDGAILLNDHEKPIEDALAKEILLIPSIETRLLYINK